MTVVMYDGSFDGLLTAIFEVYEHKFVPACIENSSTYAPSVFDKQHTAHTDEQKAARVWKGLKQKVSHAATAQLYKTYLSEEPGMETMVLQYVQHVFSHPQSIEGDFAHPAVLYVAQTAKKVYREKHRMEAFIRFELLKDGLFYAVCEPDLNVLPLLEKHFADRYADQRWLIYDRRRRYGISYDMQQVNVVEMKFIEGDGIASISAYDEHETLYQLLWQQYFSSVNIKARKNTKLHIQHMPKRYWKYLPEKRPR